jgi:predicted phosphodiesterase
MRIAILSDIHANLEALLEVLSDLDRQEVDGAVSLGDNVGYGPEPDRVVRLLRHRGIPSVMGNHEWGLLDRANQDWFNPQARKALERTEELLSKECLAYCRSLPFFWVEGGCRFVHGCPPDDVVTYLFHLSDEEVKALLCDMKERLCFVGHTHDLVMVSMDQQEIAVRKLGPGLHVMEGDGPWLINAGSVGQPRDGDNRAKYLIWEPDNRTLEARFIPYDIRKTAEAIIAAGIPRVYADRLW